MKNSRVGLILESCANVLTLIASFVIHSYNMFGFPYFENDEGTYLSQAWSLLKFGKLSPYTYWYDHAPAGWMFTSLWLFLTGGIHTFGFSLNSGRVFMLVLHVLSTYFLIKIGKRLTGSNWVGITSALIFSLTPLGLYFQRRLLLDNIMAFWVLFSFMLITGKGKKLSHYVLSGVCFGIAVLTKENAIFLVPGFIATIIHYAHRHHKRIAVVKWLFITAFVVSLYILYALLKSELFQYGTTFGGNSPHVSLLGTLQYQTSRGAGESIFDPSSSSFWRNFDLWRLQDPYMTIGGLLLTFVVLIVSCFKSRRQYLGPSLLGVFFWLFLVRGGLVIEFYIVPLIPIMSLYFAITFYELFAFMKSLFNRSIQVTVVSLFYIVLILFYLSTNSISRAFNVNNGGRSFFTSNQTQGQLEAIDWIRTNFDENTVIVFDDYSHLALNPGTSAPYRTYPNSVWYWKVDLDPAVKSKIFEKEDTIDYIAKTPQMQRDISLGAIPEVGKVLEESAYVRSFNTDGWGVEIWATQYPSKILKRSWEYYKERFLIQNEYTVDPANEFTTSEGQSYALLRAVWMDDRSTFDSVWNWTENNLMNESGTFAWKWGLGEDGVPQILDTGTASDGDTDIALALLFAHKRWNNDTYLTKARKVLQGIWNTEVKSFQGSIYLVPGNWAVDRNDLIINPSYLSPYAYKIFAEADPYHDWNEVVDSSYEMLENCMITRFDSHDISVGLPPNWCSYNSDGDVVPSPVNGLSSTEYTYDAVRTMWRLALDYEWYQDERAMNLLSISGTFLENEWTKNGRILMGYTHDGLPWENYESVLGYATSIANLAVTNPHAAQSIYDTQVKEKFYEDFDANRHYWEDKDNYYTQNWAWFGTALFHNKLPNLWR